MADLDKHKANNLIAHIAAAERKVHMYDNTGNLVCDRCGVRNARKNRQRTSYFEEDSNWAILCPECQEEADEYWADMWQEYYMSVL